MKANVKLHNGEVLHYDVDMDNNTLQGFLANTMKSEIPTYMVPTTNGVVVIDRSAVVYLELVDDEDSES